MQNNTEVKSKSYQEDFLVSLGAEQANAKDISTTVTSGIKCCKSLQMSKPPIFLEKMCRDLLTKKWACNVRQLTWKERVSKQGISYYQLAVSMPLTKGTEFSLWATPNTMDHLPQKSAETLLKQKNGVRKNRSRPSN